MGFHEIAVSSKCLSLPLAMLSTLVSTLSFQAPAAGLRVGAPSLVSMTAITPGDVGPTKPLGVYDPLQLMTKNPEKYRRFQEMEIKHGRMSMAGWAQIVCLIAIIDNSLFAQDPNLAPGDVVGDKIPWVRYSDPAVKEFKLNAERNNGRAAMMGIVGMVIHEVLSGNPLFPLPAPGA